MTVLASATLLTLAAAGGPSAGGLGRILVLDLTSPGVEVAVARNLSEVFTLAIRKAAPGATVIGQNEVSSLLAFEKQKDLLGCSDNLACLAEIGGALGAEHLALGSVGRVAGVYLLTLKLVRSRNAETVRHISEEVRGEDRLIEATRQWGAHLVEPMSAAGVGYLDIRGNGAVAVDGAAAGVAPVPRYPAEPGAHRVVWATTGHETTVDVEAYVTTRAVPAARSSTSAPAPAVKPGALPDTTVSTQPRASEPIKWLWVGAGVALLGAGVALDRVPDSAKNEKLDFLDFVPVVLYGGGLAVGLMGVF